MDLWDYVKKLSEADKKSLSQKALKTAEEVGELAKVVLPFTNAAATTHRFVDRARILEECCDTILCAASVAFDLGFTKSEIEDEMLRKATYWEELQAREMKDGVPVYPAPYEIHVTVKAIDIETFKQDCQAVGVKPILLDLYTSGGTTNDLMTSSVHIGNNSSAMAELERIANRLVNLGYEVLRHKIETVPWHPAAPSRKHASPKMPPDFYFESHLNIVCSDDRRAKLDDLCREHKAHLSRNIFKMCSETEYTIMSTYRKYTGTYEDFLEETSRLKGVLVENGFDVEKTIVEFSIYDTNVSHDSAWIG